MGMNIGVDFDIDTLALELAEYEFFDLGKNAPIGWPVEEDDADPQSGCDVRSAPEEEPAIGIGALRRRLHAISAMVEAGQRPEIDDADLVYALLHDSASLGFRRIRHDGKMCLALLSHPAAPGRLFKLVDTHEDAFALYADACLNNPLLRRDSRFLKVFAVWTLPRSRALVEMERLGPLVSMGAWDFEDMCHRANGRLYPGFAAKEIDATEKFPLDGAADILRWVFGESLSPDLHAGNVMERPDPCGGPGEFVILDPYSRPNFE